MCSLCPLSDSYCLKLINTVYGSIFHCVFYTRIDVFIHTVAHQGCFMEAAQDQLQFICIRVNIADSPDPFYTGRIVFSIYYDSTFINI